MWAQCQAQRFPVHMATPMMQAGIATYVASSSGQGQVPASTAPTGQDIVDQPMETPLSTDWQYGQLPVAQT
eukprot:12890237-Prorocentrum_lima.AAC.1